MDQVQDDIANDVSVLGVIGIDGSPSCGVHQTCYGYCGGTIGSGDWVDRSTKSVRLDRGQGSVHEDTLRDDGRAGIIHTYDVHLRRRALQGLLGGDQKRTSGIKEEVDHDGHLLFYLSAEYVVFRLHRGDSPRPQRRL